MIGTGEIVTAMARGRMLPTTSFTGEPPRYEDRHTDGGADRDGGGSRRIAGPSRLAAQAGLCVREGGLELLDAAAVDLRDRFAYRAGERRVDGAGFAAVVDGHDAGRAWWQRGAHLLLQAAFDPVPGEFSDQG